MCHTLKTRLNHKYLVYICLLLTCIKGKLVLLLDKTGNVSQETRPKFIDSQNFYFHFHYKLFCILAVRFSDKLSLMCPLIWPIEYIYMYRSLCTYTSFECVTHLGKSYANATQFRSVFRKTKKSWIEVCWKFCSFDSVGWKCKSVFIGRAV